MKNLIFFGKRVKKRILFILIITIFLAAIYISTSREISNEKKNSSPPQFFKSEIRQTKEGKDKENFKSLMNKNVTKTPKIMKAIKKNFTETLKIKEAMKKNVAETTKITTVINTNVTEKPIETHARGVECFYNDSENILLELRDNEFPLEEAIFFHESSCPENISDIKLSFRQACSVESALKAHPEKKVFLLISSPVKVQASGSKNVFIKELLTYHNFNARHINYERHLSNTPITKLYDSKALSKSEWPTAHASDILRYATLYKFGGLYSDLDVIFLKPVSNLTDFTAPESPTSLAEGIMHFSFSQAGREVSLACAEEISNTFNGQNWQANGSSVIDRVLGRRCGTNKASEMTESRCKGFHVYSSSYFYPIYYKDYKIIFESGKTELVKKLIKDSYAVYVWNKLTARLNLTKGSDVPYLKLAEIYCPKVLRANQDLKMLETLPLH